MRMVHLPLMAMGASNATVRINQTNILLHVHMYILSTVPQGLHYYTCKYKISQAYIEPILLKVLKPFVGGNTK